MASTEDSIIEDEKAKRNAFYSRDEICQAVEAVNMGILSLKEAAKLAEVSTAYLSMRITRAKRANHFLPGKVLPFLASFIEGNGDKILCYYMVASEPK